MEEKKLHVRIVPMTADHLDEVAELERICFTTPWSRNMLAEELDNYKVAFEYIVEEVAYTWFNRMIAIRFMEVNGYLPIRVLSSESGKHEPDIVTTPFDAGLEFTGEESDRIYELRDNNRLEELFRMLFIRECNHLHDILPELFEATNDYSELLLSLSYTDKDGVVFHQIYRGGSTNEEMFHRISDTLTAMAAGA